MATLHPAGHGESSARAATTLIEAAGGIVERATPDGPRIAIVRRERYGTEWALPKGKRQPGESLEETALREVAEETGLRATLVAFAGVSTYVAKGVPKLVVYWRMRADADAPFRPNEETTEIRWLSPEEAVVSITHPDQAALVASSVGLPRVGPRSWWRPWTWWAKGTRWRRLDAELDAYRLEIRARAELQDKMESARAIEPLLARARQAADDGDVDRGWRCLRAARRVELLVTDDLCPEVEALGKEAAKLDGWRRDAVKVLLAGHCPDKAAGENVPNRASVCRAAALRDEHYDNQAYKDVLRRGHAARLAVLLGLVLLALFRWVHGGALAEWVRAAAASDRINLYQVLVTVGLFGLLGATVSAILAVPVSSASTRIPETASTLRVTVLRLFMGPAAAVLLFVVCQSKLATTIFNFTSLDPYTLLAIAFVAGTSERLVLRVVRTIAGNPSDKEKEPHGERG